jgi:hypothetical protein
MTTNLHFLHIAKCAGTQMAEIAKGYNSLSEDFHIVKHPHSMRLQNLPSERYFFSIRNPVSRFFSAFYSRKRKGQPRAYFEWTSDEAIAFGEFEHANDLAEALFDAETAARSEAAFYAIRSIAHCNTNQINWFNPPQGNFLKSRPPYAIIRQENFRDDLRELSKKIGFDLTSLITDDNIKAHRNDYSGVPPLSEKAVNNLTKWYSQDVVFYKVCENWINRVTHSSKI